MLGKPPKSIQARRADDDSGICARAETTPWAALRAASAMEISAEMRDGTWRDAVLYSVGANAAHGLPRTNEDKRRAGRRCWLMPSGRGGATARLRVSVKFPTASSTACALHLRTWPMKWNRRATRQRRSILSRRRREPDFAAPRQLNGVPACAHCCPE